MSENPLTKTDTPQETEMSDTEAANIFKLDFIEAAIDFDTALTFVRAAKRYVASQVSLCNGPETYNPLSSEGMERWQTATESRSRDAEDTMLGIVSGTFPGGYTLNLSDPRGYCVHIVRPDGRHNTWGGASHGWGIEL
tara:strand:+ start:309 stop:722 length:414 start_codon:yes stop_codon:yes gene_type:complete